MKTKQITLTDNQFDSLIRCLNDTINRVRCHINYMERDGYKCVMEEKLLQSYKDLREEVMKQEASQR